MGAGISSNRSERNKRVTEQEPPDLNSGNDNYSYHFASEGINFVKTPLAYRDTDGKIKLYADGCAPTILVPNDDTPTKTTDGKCTEDSVDDKVSRRTDSPESEDDVDSIGSATVDYDFPKPPVKTRRDLIPDEEIFRLIDEHSFRAPPDIKEDFVSLVNYLTEVTCSPIEHVRAFYIWITHNINFDISGFFGRDNAMPTDPTSVLKNRVTGCQGYTELMEAFCCLVNIPVKTIYGFVKAHGYQAETDATSDRFNAHAWNAVFIKGEWRLLDVTWGAGFLKTRERVYVPRLNDVYFLTDPSVFITDHFPYMENNNGDSEKWQLLELPLDKKTFNEILDMDKYGKAWGIETVSHKNAIIHDVQFDIDIIIQETCTCLSDYVAFLFMDGRKLAQFTYIYKFDGTRVNIHVTVPVVGAIVLQLYGRRAADDKQVDLKQLLRYRLMCTKAHDPVIPYPLNHTVYGPVADFESYGLSNIGSIYHVTKTGEVTLRVQPTRDVDFIPQLHFGDHREDLKRFTLVNFTDDLEKIDIITRLPFVGNFKLTLFGNSNRISSNSYKPFMIYLLENIANVPVEVFPVALAHSVKYKCCLCEPLVKNVPSKSNVTFQVKSRMLARVKVGETYLVKTDDSTFCGSVPTPYANNELKMYGAEEYSDLYHPLYTFNTK